MQFKDYDANKIADKLKQVLEFEAKYGENDWKKWCNDINYRKSEWQWRQSIAKSHAYKHNITSN